MNYIKELEKLSKKQKSRTDIEWDLLDKNLNGPENVGKERKDYKIKNFWKKDWNK